MWTIPFPQTTFKGRVFMTHATKAIYRWLLSDYIKVRYSNNILFCLRGTPALIDTEKEL